MAILLTNTEKHIIAALKQGLPATATPYTDLAETIGIDKTELLTTLKRFKTDRIIRRIGAIANHFRLGLAHGAMVAWQIEPEKISAVAPVLASFKSWRAHLDRQSHPRPGGDTPGRLGRAN